RENRRRIPKLLVRQKGAEGRSGNTHLRCSNHPTLEVGQLGGEDFILNLRFIGNRKIRELDWQSTIRDSRAARLRAIVSCLRHPVTAEFSGQVWIEQPRNCKRSTSPFLRLQRVPRGTTRGRGVGTGRRRFDSRDAHRGRKVALLSAPGDDA